MLPLNIIVNTDQKHSGLSESVCPNVSRKITNYRLYKQADMPYFYCGPQKEKKKEKMENNSKSTKNSTNSNNKNDTSNINNIIKLSKAISYDNKQN